MKFPSNQPLKRSFWFEEAELEKSVQPPLIAEQHSDIAIIGGGFVGLWTAFHIKQKSPQTQVSIIEQDLCGSGASGRNGGMAMTWWPKISTLLSFCSKQQALFLAQSAEQAVRDLESFCEKYQIDAQLRMDGWLWTATSPQHINSWKTTLEACASLGVHPFEKIDPESVAEQAGSPVHLAGVFEKYNATLQPALLVKGLKRVVLDLGVKIYERSAVQEIKTLPALNILTPQGNMRCKKVILATNAWSATINELGKMIAPVNSSIMVTEPFNTQKRPLKIHSGVGITDCQLMVDYYRTTPQHRLAFGKGTGALSYGSCISDVFSEHPESIALTLQDFKRTYPELANSHITHTWSGPIDRTYDSLPVFGHLSHHHNILYGIGWSGNGVSPSQLGGKILSSLALELQDEWSQCALVQRQTKKFPPEPFRYVGGNMVRNAVIRKERLEIQGKVPRKLDVLLAKLAPAGLEDKA